MNQIDVWVDWFQENRERRKERSNLQWIGIEWKKKRNHRVGRDDEDDRMSNRILEDNRDRYQREEWEWKDEWNTVVGKHIVSRW